MHEGRIIAPERLTALIVDDNRSMRDLLRSMLRVLRIGTTQEAEDTAAALDILRRGTVDFLILDWMMKPQDGLDFARFLRTAADSPAPRIPILMVTGHAEPWRVCAARDAGVTEFLAKPVSANALAERIATMLNDPRPFILDAGYAGPDRRRVLPDRDGPGSRRAPPGAG